MVKIWIRLFFCLVNQLKDLLNAKRLLKSDQESVTKFEHLLICIGWLLKW